MFIGLLIVSTIGSVGKSLAFNSKGSINWVSRNNQPCQTRPTTVKLKSDKTLVNHLLLVLLSLVEVSTLLMIHMFKFMLQVN